MSQAIMSYIYTPSITNITMSLGSSTPRIPPHTDALIQEAFNRSTSCLELAQDVVPNGPPAPREIVAHLKLLRCFAELKKRIIASDDNEHLWKTYVTMAARRFLVFMNAIKGISTSALSETLDRMSPPIDVIMVWHSFMLKTLSFTNHCKRNQLQGFFNYSFPLKAITDLINDSTFVFVPTAQLQANFESFMQDTGSFVYDSYQMFDASMVLMIHCPVCAQDLVTIPLIDFADSRFQVSEFENCNCGFQNSMSHDELNKRIFWKDVMDFWYPVTSEYQESRIRLELVKNTFMNLVSKTFEQFIDELGSSISLKSFTQMRSYMGINPINLTIPGNAFHLQDDLVECVASQGKFITSMEQSNWIYSQLLEDIIEDGIERYKNFVLVFKDATFTVVPTLDIELVWNTHQLNQSGYQAYTQEACGKVLRHNDQIEESKLIAGFTETCRKYKELFNQEYSICFCGPCSYRRIRSRSLFSHKAKSGQTLFKANSVHHLSTCQKTESHLRFFYKQSEHYVPWEEKHIQNYVTSSLVPIYEGIETGSLFQFHG
ncbi:hypothetical protein CANTEDRAFT_126499 [Yamadazyma tenuis ATCC 10573]|uniref:Uncharacterized protein n=1 Tax=Candida tenuis (strain ATCC 10573 / BCRC 21748 / CBS 615 / JCM 9827 / NBRC 10315 / NRRL Y-1498 / VKM Y-70) TaxID=590646 RepID=G3B959_CANTC|nr:uncharacterized protein CANTEDRAFT_126499 [Yamadazyma tenuis ATCC 10573]EGV62468.1 hypothetical protein CANTEDRAFT_126499 [Yamadazyma tenuis ATCC 10573]